VEAVLVVPDHPQEAMEAGLEEVPSHWQAMGAGLEAMSSPPLPW